MLLFGSYLWAFIKEIFFGNKIKDPYSEKDSDAQTGPSRFITKLQKSRPMLAAFSLCLMLSLFINYRTISKLNTLGRIEEENVKASTYNGTKEKKPVPVIPDKNDKDIKDDTVDFLNSVYSQKQ